MSGPRCWAVVPAAGSGRRMAAGVPKQYLALGGATVLEQTLRRFAGHPEIAATVVVIPRDDPRWMTVDPALRRTVLTAVGGRERSDSVAAGLRALAGRAALDDWVLVHDAARPCLPRADLDRLLDRLRGDPVGGLLAAPVRDTLKRADADLRVIATVDRESLWHAQTPQMFRLGLLADALEKAAADGVLVTDEAMAVERLGYPVRLVEGSAANLKITRPEDLELAAFYLAKETR